MARTIRHIATITDVAERQLCTGCGASAYVQPDDIRMVDDIDAGRRPIVRRDTGGNAVSTARALEGCPGVGLEHGPDPVGVVDEVRAGWGPVLEVWEGHAADPAVRLSGSSGGAATALALFCLDERSMHGVLHIRARHDVPYLNETVLSTSREAMLAATGSRYAPASPCDRLDLVRDADGPCVVIGKPCDVAATSKIRSTDRALDAKIGLTIGIFCAGTPTTRGTLEMLQEMGVHDPMSVRGLRYRGNGWPGNASVSEGSDRELTYAESWGAILQRHRQWRCYVCADHTGEFADVAVGDPWYREPDGSDPGQSLIVVRTERGRAIVREAVEAGVLNAHRVDPDRIPASQAGLIMVRGAVWGRLMMCRLLRIPAPVYRGFPMFPSWLHYLDGRRKLRSTVGLIRRVQRKGLYRRHEVVEFES